MLRLDLRPETALYDTSKYHITYKITIVASLKSQGRKQVKEVEKLTVLAQKYRGKVLSSPDIYFKSRMLKNDFKRAPVKPLSFAKFLLSL